MTTETAFKEGDVVRLRSGGPKMTVTTVADQWGTMTAWCSWFEGMKAHDGTFPITALKPADNEAAAPRSRVVGYFR